MNQLSTLDIGVIAVYLIGIVIYGISKSKRGSSEEYFLGGRTMTWPIVGIALFSANISSSTLVGLASDGFQTNINVYNYEWYAVIVLIIFAIFFLPFYLKSGVYTMPEFLERRFDRRSRYYFSFITVIGNVMVDTAAALYVGSIVLKLLFPAYSSTTIIILLAIAAAAYTIPGGSKFSYSNRGNSGSTINHRLLFNYLFRLRSARWRMVNHDVLFGPDAS